MAEMRREVEGKEEEQEEESKAKRLWKDGREKIIESHRRTESSAEGGVGTRGGLQLGERDVSAEYAALRQIHLLSPISYLYLRAAAAAAAAAAADDDIRPQFATMIRSDPMHFTGQKSQMGEAASSASGVRVGEEEEEEEEEEEVGCVR
ncbi:hypothetical protein MBM_05530 [Drepanopeziza brunnea f. sp. 'multigermtubi' MB_m1]|uniref:Uncharacterized protein n=1 Tax=Marssonina brunnea f. sp. multigermtubi (strain MB_m1) TaxID=1072389 RepID=K1WT54_MARBU|nr:uncharacterized protein MBM_05530 [Drepanopeziza brunnea f. sp. 'multigermtubi' MB_m1]EKD16236.1 hypothetical protein MBM_05530 [Drepanopeziza brunnea f. sp. 'multigermtubi' MB_m1]